MIPRPRPIPLRSLSRPLALLAATSALAVCAAACSSGGRWGHTKEYTPTKDERSAIADAKELDAPMAQLKPEAWRGMKVRFFMVVDERKPGPGGSAYLSGKVHTLNEINNCENKYDEESCRVTIKPTGHEKVHVVVQLRSEDDVGPDRCGPGSLVRVVGQLTDKMDEEDGKLVVSASWYRNWPLGYYVTEGQLKQ